MSGSCAQSAMESTPLREQAAIVGSGCTSLPIAARDQHRQTHVVPKHTFLELCGDSSEDESPRRSCSSPARLSIVAKEDASRQCEAEDADSRSSFRALSTDEHLSSQCASPTKSLAVWSEVEDSNSDEEIVECRQKFCSDSSSPAFSGSTRGSLASSTAFSGSARGSFASSTAFSGSARGSLASSTAFSDSTRGSLVSTMSCELGNLETRRGSNASALSESSQELLAEGRPSVGSSAHGSGACTPCAWFWKPQGCRWAEECRYCHMCSRHEIGERKKAKITKFKIASNK